MSDPCNQAKSIFLAAIEEHAPEQWPGFLDQACAGDARLRAEVEKLLRARSEMGSFHEPPRPAALATVDAPAIAERPGTIIGPYKLLEQIGEGGFGLVFMAEQQQPVRRKVALKVLKPGMDTRQVIARFEAERQALALMDHPNIARVLDAGETGSGRPHFVMELVKGVPITDYCDQNRLTTRERLELFIARLPGRAARAPEGHHSPRLQAVERHGDAARRRAGRQGDRLRHRQGTRAAAHGQDALYRLRADGRHAAVHEPRAGRS